MANSQCDAKPYAASLSGMSNRNLVERHGAVLPDRLASLEHLPAFSICAVRRKPYAASLPGMTQP